MNQDDIRKILKHNNVNGNKKSKKYIWRTQKDNKVRSSHADRDGKIYDWDDPPPGGHPGEDFGCRCWAEPIEALKEEKKRISKDPFIQWPGKLSIPASFIRYFKGTGNGILTLDQMGLLDDIKRSSGTEKARTRFREQLRGFIENEMIISQPGTYPLENYFENSYSFHDQSIIIGNGTLGGHFQGKCNS